MARPKNDDKRKAMDASAQTTLAFMAAIPAAAARYQTLGFEMFWRGVGKK